MSHVSKLIQSLRVLSINISIERAKVSRKSKALYALRLPQHLRRGEEARPGCVSLFHEATDLPQWFLPQAWGHRPLKAAKSGYLSTDYP